MGEASLPTGDDDGGSSVDDAAVRPYTVPARCGRLHFETYFSVRGVLQFEVGGDYICERTCRDEREQMCYSFVFHCY